MQFLTKIPNSAAESYRTCIQGLESRYEGVKDIVDNASTIYEKLASRNDLHLMPKVPDLNRGPWNVTGDDMRALYKNKFAKLGEPGRDLYDSIKLLTNKCPLCRVGRVRELDHYLPKKLYPALAVSPANLIPVCKDCNYDKRTKTPSTAEETWPHPYFDNIQNDKWLCAKLVLLSKPEVQYFLICPSGWKSVTFQRLETFFEDLELGLKYSIEAATKIGEIAGMVSEVYKEENCNGVATYLSRSGASIARTNLNHWEAAMYECLSNDSWYCNGGFSAFL